jgi:hypothetical protein
MSDAEHGNPWVYSEVDIIHNEKIAHRATMERVWAVHDWLAEGTDEQRRAAELIREAIDHRESS